MATIECADDCDMGPLRSADIRDVAADGPAPPPAAAVTMDLRSGRLTFVFSLIWSMGVLSQSTE